MVFAVEGIDDVVSDRVYAKSDVCEDVELRGVLEDFECECD